MKERKSAHRSNPPLFTSCYQFQSNYGPQRVLISDGKLNSVEIWSALGRASEFRVLCACKRVWVWGCNTKTMLSEFGRKGSMWRSLTKVRFNRRPFGCILAACIRFMDLRFLNEYFLYFLFCFVLITLSTHMFIPVLTATSTYGQVRVPFGCNIIVLWFVEMPMTENRWHYFHIHQCYIDVQKCFNFKMNIWTKSLSPESHTEEVVVKRVNFNLFSTVF